VQYLLIWYYVLFKKQSDLEELLRCNFFSKVH